MKKKGRIISAFISTLLLVLIISTPKVSNAAWYNNAIDYFTTYPKNDSKMVYNIGSVTAREGQFYFGQKGITRYSATNTYYSIEGFKYTITDPRNGKVYSGAMNVTDNMARWETAKDGYTYTLWRITIPTMVENLKYHNPNGDFSFIYDTNWSKKVIFNAIVSINTNGNRNGYVGKYGNTTSGSVVTSMSGLPDWMTLEEKMALFNITGDIPREDNPKAPDTFMQVNGNVWAYGPNDTTVTEWNNDASAKRAKYKDSSGNLWVNLKEPFTIYTINGLSRSTPLGTTAYPSYGRSGIDTSKNENDPTNLFYYYITNTSGTFSTSSAFTNDFTVNSARRVLRSTSSYNYNDVFYDMTAKKDGQTYYVKTKTYVGSTPGNNWYYLANSIKTDGKAPTGTSSQSYNNYNSIKINLNNVTDNGGSGVKNVYAYIYPSGATSKGNKIQLTQSNSNWSATVTISNYTSSQANSLIVEYHTVDNVDNDGAITATANNRPNPNTGSSVSISGQNYTDTTNKIKWFNLSTTATITVGGTSNYVAPTYLKTIFSTNNDSNNFGTIAYNAEMTSTGISQLEYSKIQSTNTSNKMTVSGTYSSTGKFTVKGLSSSDGGKYYVFGQSNVSSNYRGTYVSETNRIGFDGTAPNITGTKSYGWTNQDVTVSLSSTDSSSGVKNIELKNGTTVLKSGTTSLSYTVSAQGVYNYKVSSSDNVNNVKTEDISIKIDKTKPSASFNPNGKDWTNSTVNVTVTPSDSGGSGVKQWQYRVSNDNGATYGAWSSAYTSSSEVVKVSKEGKSKIQTYVVDKAGNSEYITSETYYLDLTKPTATFNPNSSDWTNKNVDVTINTNDTGGSQLKNWNYKISKDSGTNYYYTSSTLTSNLNKITLSEEGYNMISVISNDNAGNTNTNNSGIYKIDKTSPTGVVKVTNREDDTFDIEISNIVDVLSGLKTIVIDLSVDTPKGTITKKITPTKKGDIYTTTINRNDYNGVTKTYNFDVTLTDVAGNSRTYSNNTGTMIQNNLVAQRIDVYDPREKRYVTQTVKGLDYVLVLQVKNSGERAITKNFDAEFKADNVTLGSINITDGINKDEVKDYKLNFKAGEVINLKGVNYAATIDSSNKVYETNETDNKATSKQYPKDKTDEDPPKIPGPDDYNPEGKPEEEIPIINIDIDFEAYDIETYSSSGKVLNELVVGDFVDIEYSIKNNSSLALEYLDIANKEFANKFYYDNTVIHNEDINSIKSGEIKKIKVSYLIPSLADGVVETTKQLKLEVDTNKSINESNENNNTKVKNKKVIALKLIEYQINSMINPIKTYNYPVPYTSFPVNAKAGYDVSFSIKAKGNPTRVYVKIKDSNGYDYGITELNKVSQDDDVTSTWAYNFYPLKETEKGTIIYTEVIATRSSSSYNFNEKESFDGKTILIEGSALEDIIIYRRY